MMKQATATLLCLVVLVKSFDLQENDVCRSEYLNADGICVRPEQCEHFAEHKNELKICSFDGKVPVVCCPAMKTTKLRRSAMSMFKNICVTNYFIKNVSKYFRM